MLFGEGEKLCGVDENCYVVWVFGCKGGLNNECRLLCD